MFKQNWEKIVVSTAVFFAALFLLAFLHPVNADDGSEEYNPEHGIPLMIIRIDESGEGIQNAKEEDPDHEYGTIQQMNNSSDHSVRCIGTAELKVPEGYSGGYRSLPYDLTTGEMKLSYIRGRGNSTWFGAKKPYKIKLDKKQDLLGMGKSKEWALLAERVDPTLMKNRITYELGAEMGLRFTPQIVPIEVIMVGSESGAEYLGVFNLAETIKLEASRIDLNEPEDDEITGSYIVSLYNVLRDYKEPESNRFFTSSLSGVFGFLNKEPEYLSEDLTEAQQQQRAYIRNYINETENLIMSSDHIDHDLHMQIAEKMDLQSAADYWWIQSLSRNVDAFYTSSTYMYKEANGKLYWGPLWDFDLAYGRNNMFTNALVTEGFMEFCPFPWFTQLRMCDPEFVELLKERWHVLDEKLAAITAEGGSLDRYRDEVAQAQAADYKKWNSVSGLTYYYAKKDYYGTVEKLRTFIEKRRAWINANLDAVGSFRAVRFDAGEGEGSMESRLDLTYGAKMKLPACEFTPKAGSCLTFDCWLVNGQRYQEGETIRIRKDTAASAVWKTEHSWREANCTDPKTCTVCGKTEGKPKGHGLVKIPAKAATLKAKGNKAHYKCSVCGKLFLDSKGSVEVTKDAVTLPKLKKNSITKVTPASGTIARKAVRNKEQSIQLKATDKGGAKITFKRDPKTDSKTKQYISVSKTGTIKVRKGTPKGKYIVKVKVSAAGTKNYAAASVTKRVKIVVK